MYVFGTPLARKFSRWTLKVLLVFIAYRTYMTHKYLKELVSDDILRKLFISDIKVNRLFKEIIKVQVCALVQLEISVVITN